MENGLTDNTMKYYKDKSEKIYDHILKWHLTNLIVFSVTLIHAFVYKGSSLVEI